MTVVDTSVWIAAFGTEANQHTAWLDLHLTSEELALTDSIICEVLQGIRDDAQFRKASSYLLNFPVYDTGGTDLALAAARNYRFLRKKGVTVRGTIDCIIATFCIREGHSLLHRDRDYDVFERHLGLSVVHP